MLILVFGAGFGWLNAKLRPWAAIQAIEKLGGKVILDEQSPGTPVVSVVLHGESGLKHLARLRQLRTLTTGTGGPGGHNFTNAGLVHLKGLTQLQRLVLCNIWVTDASLERLKGLTQLHTLALNRTSVTDAGLVHLKGLTQLQTLWLPGTQVTDAGIGDLKKTLPNVDIRR